MQLSKKAINDLQVVFNKLYKKEITDNEANDLGMVFLAFFRLIYRQVPIEDDEILKSLRLSTQRHRS